MKNTLLTLCGLLAACSSLTAQVQIVHTTSGQADLFDSSTTDFILEYELQGGAATNVLAVGFFWDNSNLTANVTDLAAITFGGVAADGIENRGVLAVAYWFNPSGSNFSAEVTRGVAGREAWIIHELANVETTIAPEISNTSNPVANTEGVRWTFSTAYADSRIINWIALRDDSFRLSPQSPNNRDTLSKRAEVIVERTGSSALIGDVIGLIASGTAAAAMVGDYDISWNPGGNSDVGIALAFAPTGSTRPVISPWEAFSLVNGLKDTAEFGDSGIGWIEDSHYPWVYSASLAADAVGDGWIFVDEATATLTGMYAYQSSTDEWLWIHNNLDGWFYRFPTSSNPANGWELLP